jgi:GTPase SAR1 family protein
MVGDAGVGKTHLLNKYTKGTVTKSPSPTIGV